MSISRIHLAYGLMALLCAAVLAGCSSSKTASPEEVAAFRGNPSKMPADFKAKVAAAQASGMQAQQAAQQKAAQTANAPK
jgi:hypothetical protein